MTKPNIEVNLAEKTISTDGRSLRLEDSFEGVGIFNIGNSNNELALELNYRKKQGFCETDEGERVYNFLQDSDNNKLKKLEVNSTRKEDFNRDVFPAVIIYGKFNYNISNPI